MNSKKVEENLDEISLALSKTDDAKLITNFLKCILTENELYELSSRWALVKMLDDGKSQRYIASELGLSLCKITRGSKELKKTDSAFKKMIDFV